jgi:hypothetical protein
MYLHALWSQLHPAVQKQRCSWISACLGPAGWHCTQLEPTIGQRLLKHQYFELEHVSGGCESQIWAKKLQFILWMLCSVFVVAL